MSLTKEQYDKLMAFVYQSNDNGMSKFPGMTYEQGIEAVLSILDGDETVEEAIGEA
jgi:hypothetical protein